MLSRGGIAKVLVFIGRINPFDPPRSTQQQPRSQLEQRVQDGCSEAGAPAQAKMPPAARGSVPQHHMQPCKGQTRIPKDPAGKHEANEKLDC